MLSLKTPSMTAASSAKRSVRCHASHHRLQTELNKFIDKRRALDLRRAEEVKAAAEKLRDIARQEIQSTLELANIMVPVGELKKKKACCDKDNVVAADEGDDA